MWKLATCFLQDPFALTFMHLLGYCESNHLDLSCPKCLHHGLQKCPQNPWSPDLAGRQSMLAMPGAWHSHLSRRLRWLTWSFKPWGPAPYWYMMGVAFVALAVDPSVAATAKGLAGHGWTWKANLGWSWRAANFTKGHERSFKLNLLTWTKPSPPKKQEHMRNRI